MKKIILFAGLMLACCVMSAQEYKRNGKEFSIVKQEKSNSADILTGYTWKDSKGDVYDIYISKKGSCYIIKTSKKTGKQYRQYLPKEVSNTIAEELGMSNQIDYE